MDTDYRALASRILLGADTIFAETLRNGGKGPTPKVRDALNLIITQAHVLSRMADAEEVRQGKFEQDGKERKDFDDVPF